MLSFISKTTYSQDLKIVLIDNIENLNINATNALLKALEEPSNNTFFFIIHNNSYKLVDTIKSRCTEFKIFFTREEKKSIFKKIKTQYPDFNNTDFFEKFLDFDTPGNIIKYASFFNKANFTEEYSTLSCIFY